MYVSVWPSEDLSRRQRSHGRIALTVQRFGSVTRVAQLHESGPSRLRLPRIGGDGLEAVLINTGGGIASGDRYDMDFEVRPGAQLTVTTPGAEKVYRSEGPLARMAVGMTVAEDASLAWLPQETILFNEARLKRSFDVDLDPTSRFLMAELTVFGRAAFAEEQVTTGHFEDRWRIRRGGRLLYADTLRFTGPISEWLARPSVAAGAKAMATVLYVAPDAEGRLEETRAILEQAAPAAAATAWNGMLIARFLSPTIAELRRHVVHFVTRLRSQSMPRVWQT
ncbi:urease accessory protein UreD [Agaricicola taiwanensis]|uniref:Urease accessory protein UreD n=2 Tax=Agaricicola taiwanensis TaxID=591372 RepID=A0A8J2VN68_9RHOB|nr:urease accessory protein UreD [Agaricicola taiwanensis]